MLLTGVSDLQEAKNKKGKNLVEDKKRKKK
jgi:hypothetical protein